MAEEALLAGPDAVADWVSDQLSRLADPSKAGPMAAYMKTDMPFYGVQKPERRKVSRLIKRRFRPAAPSTYEATVLALWQRRHREEKYLAIDVAQLYPDFIGPRSMSLFERLITEGAWWDLVDPVATKLVGGALQRDASAVGPVLDEWIEHPDMWLRRAALLAQVGRKADTDEARLFRHCLACAREREFFIRKAVGWALRDYSYTAPEAVARFLDAHRAEWSGLTYREASKALRRGVKQGRSR